MLSSFGSLQLGQPTKQLRPEECVRPLQSKKDCKNPQSTKQKKSPNQNPNTNSTSQIPITIKLHHPQTQTKHHYSRGFISKTSSKHAPSPLPPGPCSGTISCLQLCRPNWPYSNFIMSQFSPTLSPVLISSLAAAATTSGVRRARRPSDSSRDDACPSQMRLGLGRDWKGRRSVEAGERGSFCCGEGVDEEIG